MDIKTKYDIDDIVEVERTSYINMLCDCCGQPTTGFPEKKIDTAKIERIELQKNGLHYSVRFTSNNAGSMYVFHENNILKKV